MTRVQVYLIRFILIFIVGAQIWFLSTQALFGDESFYWLESQYLDWSYAELPGWTAWMIRFGTEIFGNSYFAVRIFAFIAYLSIFYFTVRINQHLSIRNTYLNLLLIASVPLYLLLATMALPDIWMVFFSVWIAYFLFKACNDTRNSNWVILGLLVACSINVHIRMWIWLFIAGLSFLWIYRPSADLLRPILLICLPISLLGLLPIYLFNYAHEYPLLQFQLVDRQPWEFQLGNLIFVVSQLLVISPVIVYLWFQLIIQQRNSKPTNKFVKWFFLTAWLHFVFYVFMSLFADGLRTTVHWLVISFIPVLTLATINITNKKLILFSISTGLLTSLSFVYYFNFIESNTKSRIIDNSSSWKLLAENVKDAKSQHNAEIIIADYFMTASELGFELNDISSIKVLSHEKNIKHGREKQLELMNLLIKDPIDLSKSAILVIEDSAIKLQNRAKYYSNLCQQFDSLVYIKSVNDSNSTKQYHLFSVSEGGECQIPPIFYLNHQVTSGGLEISGWVIYHNIGIKELFLDIDGDFMKITNSQIKNSNIEKQFKEIQDPLAPNNGFQIQIKPTQYKTLRIKAVGMDSKEFYSSIYYLK